MFLHNAVNLMAVKINNFIVQIITSSLLLVIFLTIYVAIIGAIVGYFYFRKHRDSFNSYLNAIKYCPTITKLMIKFWIEFQANFCYDLMLSGWLKVKENDTKEYKELDSILEKQISFENQVVNFESTTLFLLTNTKDYFRFK